LSQGLRPASACPKRATSQRHGHVVVDACPESDATGDRLVRELANCHRDRVHRARPMTLIIVVDPRQAGVDGSEPGNDRAVVSLGAAIAVEPTSIAIVVSPPVAVA